MESTAPHRFALDPGLDPAALHAAYARDGRVQIAPFLREADARLLKAHLEAHEGWRTVLNSGAKVFEFDAAAPMSAEQRARLDAAVHEAARDGFQYRYDAIRIPDDPAARASARSPLADFASFMSSAAVLDMLARVTGTDAPSFADAQATAYRPGDFLTAHDDGVAGKNRHAAYVFGLSEGWRAEWGGLLLFHDADGSIGGGFVPGFNTLNVFAVPQPHSVSLVAPFAGTRRLSITGWLRSGLPG